MTEKPIEFSTQDPRWNHGQPVLVNGFRYVPVGDYLTPAEASAALRELVAREDLDGDGIRREGAAILARVDPAELAKAGIV